MYLRTLVDFPTNLIPAELGHLVVILSGFIYHHFARLLFFFDALWLVKIVIVNDLLLLFHVFIVGIERRQY